MISERAFCHFCLHNPFLRTVVTDKCCCTVFKKLLLPGIKNPGLKLIFVTQVRHCNVLDQVATQNGNLFFRAVVVTFFFMDFPPFVVVYHKRTKSPIHAEPKQLLNLKISNNGIQFGSHVLKPFRTRLYLSTTF